MLRIAEAIRPRPACGRVRGEVNKTSVSIQLKVITLQPHVRRCRAAAAAEGAVESGDVVEPGRRTRRSQGGVLKSGDAAGAVGSARIATAKPTRGEPATDLRSTDLECYEIYILNHFLPSRKSISSLLHRQPSKKRRHVGRRSQPSGMNFA